jgi:hypothetical protein
MWDGGTFNKDVFYYNLVKKGFKVSAIKGKVIREKIVELATTKVSARALALAN